MKIKDIATVRNGNKHADFWLIREGKEEEIGKPTFEFSEDYIGIEVKDTEQIFPKFLYYYFEHVYLQNYWIQFSRKNTNLQHITPSNVENLPFNVGR